MSINKTIHEFWRDWAALVYLFICLIDFFVAPLIWNIRMEAYCTSLDAGEVCSVTRWIPLTLGAGAMFHISFGAILGETSLSRHKEMSSNNNDKSDS